MTGGWRLAAGGWGLCLLAALCFCGCGGPQVVEPPSPELQPVTCEVREAVMGRRTFESPFGVHWVAYEATPSLAQVRTALGSRKWRDAKLEVTVGRSGGAYARTTTGALLVRGDLVLLRRRPTLFALPDRDKEKLFKPSRPQSFFLCTVEELGQLVVPKELERQLAEVALADPDTRRSVALVQTIEAKIGSR